MRLDGILRRQTFQYGSAPILTANYEGHHRVEAVCAIQEPQAQGLFFLYMVRATGSGITYIRENFSFSFFIRTMSNFKSLPKIHDH